MCSIIGSFKKNKFQELLKLNEHRGSFSWSLFCASVTTNSTPIQSNLPSYSQPLFIKQFGLKTGTLPSGRNAPGFNYQGPNITDRALFWIVYKHKQNRYKNEIDTEDYRNVQENL